ncbi:MAG: HAD family hydrolase [bacterium]
MPRGGRIIFLDVGNVLIDDDPFVCEAFRLIHRALPPQSPRAQMDRFLGDAERALRSHRHMAVERMGMRCLKKQWPKVRRAIQEELGRRWLRLVRALPGALEAVRALHEHFRLGIIANQPAQALDFLEQQDFLSLFDVVILDSNHPVSKPNTAIYRIALEEARVDPQESLMVGDRLDNDIIPARRTGMRAVLLWLSTKEKGWDPKDHWGQIMRPILERLPAPRWDNIPPQERPLAMAAGWNQLQGALDRAWQASI